MKVRELDELVQTGAIVLVPWADILPDKRQPRVHFDKTRMEALTGAIREGSQKLPAVVRPLVGDPNFKFKLVDGERRYRAAKELNLPVPCLIKEFSSEDEVLEFQVQANFNRDSHTAMETCNILVRLMETRRIQGLPKKQRIAALARFFGHSELWAWQYIGLRRLDFSLKKLLEPGTPKDKRIPVALAIKLSGFEPAEQLRMFKAIKAKGLNFKGARRLVDKTNLAKGLHKHRKGRRPADDFDIALRFAHRVQEEVAAILEIPDADFDRMFMHRDVEQRRGFRDELDLARQSLDRLNQRFLKAMKENPSAKTS